MGPQVELLAGLDRAEYRLGDVLAIGVTGECSPRASPQWAAVGSSLPAQRAKAAASYQLTPETG